MIVDSLMQAYHIPLREAMSLTLPQITMLNHASHVSYQRMKTKHDKPEKKRSRRNPDTEVDQSGRPVDELNSDELQAYLGDFFIASK